MSWDIFGTEREALRKKNAELNNENYNLQYENKKLQLSIEKAKQAINHTQRQFEELYQYKNKYDLACRANDVFQHKIDVLEGKLSALNESYVVLQKASTDNSNIVTENKELAKCLEESKLFISKKDEEIKRLLQTQSFIKSELEQTNGKLADALKKVNLLQNRLSEIEIEHQNQDEIQQTIKKEKASIDRIKRDIDILSTLPFARIPDDFKSSILTGRLSNAFETTNLSIYGPLHIFATIRSDDHFYETSLTKCSCPDFENRHIPCKHMLYLSYISGLLLLNKEAFSMFAQSSISRLNDKINQDKQESSYAKNQNKLLMQKKREHVKLVTRLEAELDQSYPWLAAMYKRFQIEQDNHDAYLLSNRSSSAKDIVKKLKKSNKNLKYEKALLENQLLVYETLFPWLEEFKKVDVDKAVEYVRQTQNDEEYDKVSDFLSPAEYKALSVTKKNQLALERYKKHRKSDWEVGVDYERYIGYLYETKGYKVKYSGAVDRLKDMGRDLICTRGSETLVIQCKRWSIHKTIHEKHIFQLYGSTIQLKYLNPDKEYTPVFVTSTQLSEVASYCAQQLGIQIIEKEKYTDYPCIKCNISKDGSKIYHLPFDQQYDRISIDTSNGECYALTVEEAEQKGFRRAYRHSVS